MKKSRLYIYSLFAVITICFSACSPSEKKSDIEVDSRGIPMSVSSLILGDSCKIDTLYASDDNIYMIIDNSDYRQRMIFDKSGLLVYNPTLSIDTLTSSSYRINDLLKSTIVDFANQESIDNFKEAFPIYDDFTIVTYGNMQNKPQSVVFSLSVSVASDNLKNHESIDRWVAKDIDTIPFDGSFKNFGNALSTNFRQELSATKSPAQLFEMYSSIVYHKTARYVTYFDVFNVYTGGAHGMYAYRFPTYILDENAILTYDYLFKEDAIDDIRALIYDALSEDADFASNNNVNSPSQVRKIIEDNLDGDPIPVPQPGLLPEGVIFCYQPYEIASYADGAFQLIIPYDKIHQYMTPKGRLLLK